MIPLAKYEPRELSALLFDLDDTLLSHGQLTRAAYGALWDLHDAGLTLVAVTGRPSSWGEVVVRQWPIAGAVTENGAILIVREGVGLRVMERASPEERAFRRARLDAIVAAVKEEVPEAMLTDDVSGRRADVTWDIGERVRMEKDRIARIAAVITREGARTTRSSVHIHATFDTDDKASGAMRFVTEILGLDAGTACVRCAFVGDSGNDRPCFLAFETTFGVANIRTSLPALGRPPVYIAKQSMGAGFAEIAAALLSKR